MELQLRKVGKLFKGLSKLVLTFSVVLSARTEVPKKELEKSKYKSFKKIALLINTEKTKIAIWNQGGAAAAFGPIGGAIQASSNNEHTKQFLQKLTENGVKLGPAFRSDIKSSLEKAGFEVVLIEDWPKLVDKKDDFSHIKTDADVILCAWVGWSGYLSSPGSSDYEPWMVMNTKLIEVKSQEQIYRQSFSAGHKGKTENIEYLALDDKYKFPSFSQLMEKIDLAIEGLKAGQTKTALVLSQQLLPGLKSGPEPTPEEHH